MSLTKNIIFIVFLLSFHIHAKYTQAQDSGSETTVTHVEESTNDTQNETQDKDKKDKKKKEKNLVEINAQFFWNLMINLATIFIIIGAIYYPIHRKTDYIFTFIMFNIIIFILTFVLEKVKISMGAAFGLFAVFSMLRYRTEGISIKDMTYLFIFIAIGLISAIRLEYYELAIINGTVIFLTFLFDGNFILRKEFVQSIQYENIEMIHPDKKAELLEDLKKRTGLKIHRVAITKINFLRDTAIIKVYYYE
jgi:hypothetical protein